MADACSIIANGAVLFMAAGLAILSANLALSLLTFRRPGHATSTPSPCRVSVLIPARNEESNIGPCLESAVAQAHDPLEILVLDDESTDRTAEIVSSFAERDARVRLIRGQPPPPGWIGKCWAAHQLGQAATGDLLLFTDADTAHRRGSVADAVAAMDAHGADLLSLWPRQITVSLAEKLVIPLGYALILMLRPHWLEGRARIPALGAANGQFIMFRRAAYERIGGHASVRDHIVEDVALSRRAIAAGLRLVNLDGQDQLSCRMYRGLAHLWEGLSKNLRAAFDDKPWAFVAFGALQFAFLLAPFIAVPLLAAAHQPRALWASCALCLWILLMRLGLAARFRGPVLGALLHPLGQALALVLAVNSWVLSSRGTVRWKGRSYAPSLAKTLPPSNDD
ncbi:MAG: glycosyltransferase [Verrucomicrobiae bacterium]|nr:glycosyltransferase [Verrucomicrobiae bacterium]